MHGVPANLDLRIFMAATLEQICVGEFQLQFKFDNNAFIAVEGGWRLVASNGEIIDTAESNVDRREYRVHVLLGRSVEGWAVHAPEWFELQFEEGWVLRVFDDSDRYESFSIQPGDIFV